MRGWTRIVGIDPGFRVTGFGVIESNGQDSRYIHSGVIHALKNAQTDDTAGRLAVIFAEVSELIARYEPDEMAVEQVFLARNAASALKLGQARSAAICASFQLGIPVMEYAAREVKQAIVGKGGAAKDQVQHMVRVLLSYREPLAEDAADALGIALCHAHLRSARARIAAASA